MHYLNDFSMLPVSPLKKSFNYSSVLQTDYNEKRNKYLLHSTNLGWKRNGDWDIQNDFYIVSKILIFGLTELFKKENHRQKSYTHMFW
jgi:hypothetical protein